MKTKRFKLVRSAGFPYLREVRALVWWVLAGSGVLRAEVGAGPPVLQFAAGLPGQQVHLSWASEAGVRYAVEKTRDLGGGGWERVAVVASGGVLTAWEDPEATATRCFYRVYAPVTPQVFEVLPPVLSVTGGVLEIKGRSIPENSFLRLEIPGQAPQLMALVAVAGQPGVWRASLLGAALPGGQVLSAAVVDGNGVTVCPVAQTVEITEDGFASDSPATLPPAPPVPAALSNPIPGIGIVVKKNVRWRRPAALLAPTRDEDCDDSDAAFWVSKKGYDYYLAQSDMASAGLQHNPAFQENSNAGTMPARLMKAKEKANRTPAAAALEPNGYGATGVAGEVMLQVSALAQDCPAGPPLDCVLTYRSRVASGSADFFGPNWTCAYDISVTPEPLTAGAAADRVRLRDGGGRCDLFVRQADGTFVCDGLFRSGRMVGNTFTLTFADQGTWVFRPLDGEPGQGKIAEIRDRNQVALSCAYDQSGLLTGVSNPFGQSLSFSRGSDGLVSQVMDQTQRVCTFSYFASKEPGGNPGRLRACSCPQLAGQAPVAGPTTFSYTTGSGDARLDDNLLTALDGAGRLLCGYAYADQTDPLAPDYDRVSLTHHFQTGDVPTQSQYVAAADGLLVIDNDPLGRVTETTFDRQYRPTMRRHFTGFAQPGQPVTATANRPAGKLRAGDPDFYQTRCAYNTQHCCTVRTEPDGSQQRCTYDFDLRGAECPVGSRGNPRVCTWVSPAGEQRTISMQYLTGFGVPEPGSWMPGNPIKGITVKGGRNPGGDIVANAHSIAGITGGAVAGIVVAAIVRKGGSEDCDDKDDKFDSASYTLSSPYMKKKLDKWLGKAAGGAGTSPAVTVGRQTQSASFGERMAAGDVDEDCDGRDDDCDGRVIGQKQKAWLCSNFRTRMTTTLGQVFTWGYDEHGNCTSALTPVPNQGELYQYNSNGQCTRVTTMNGTDSSFRDDFSYDPATGFCSGAVSDSTGLQLALAFEHDPLGRVTRVVDPRGYDCLYDYNPRGDCVSEQSPPLATNGSGGVRVATTFFYDAGGLASGFDLEHRDAAGSLDGANPAYSTRFLRESPSHPRRISRVAVENRPAALAPGSVDLAAAGLANFDVCDYMLDAAGQCVQQSTPAACRAQDTAAVCDYQFDELGRLFRCANGGLGAPDAVATQCDYTLTGELARCATLASVGESPATTWTRDGFQRVVACTDPMGNVQAFSYDNQGFVTCESYGEPDDAPGAAGNILLARVKVRSHSSPDGAARKGGKVNGNIIVVNSSMRANPFLDFHVEDDTCITERFAPGSPAPHAVETTVCDRSPAGLVQSVTRNGDLLVACEHDTAGRLIRCADGTCAVALTLDAGGNPLVTTRTDFASAPGLSNKLFSITASVDPLGRCVQTSAGGNVTACDYDSLDRCVRWEPPVGAPIVYDYDGGSSAQPFSVRARCDVDGDGGLDLLGSAYARGDAAACGAEWEKWEGVGVAEAALSKHYITIPHNRCRSLTDANGATTTFTLDAQDRCVQTDFPDGTHEACAFDSRGNLVSMVRKNGSVIAADYDFKDRPTTISVTDGDPLVVAVPPTLYHYNGLDDCIFVQLTGLSEVIRAYDSCGNLLSESQNGHVVSRAYDHRGRTSITYPNGARFNEVRNARGLLLASSMEGAAGPPIAAFDYQGARVVRDTRANGVVTTYQYRGAGDDALQGTGPDFSYDACVQATITTAAGDVLSSSTCTRDASQRVIQRESLYSAGSNTSAPLRRHHYTRDPLGRVIREQTGLRASAGGALVLVTDEQLTLDVQGRRLEVTGGEHPGSYAASAALPPGDLQMNQYTSWPGGDLLWDANGSLTSFSHGSAGTRGLVYDALSRLVSVVDPATGATMASYGYDACSRLISRTVFGSDAASPPEIAYFIYDGERCIQELGGDGLPDLTIAALGHCISTRNGTLYYPHGGLSDASGGSMPAVKLVTSTTATPVERIDSDHACQPVFLDRDGLARPAASQAIGPLKWMAPECLWCPESGLLAGPDGTYSPDLGLTTSEKTKPITRKREFTGHVTLMK